MDEFLRWHNALDVKVSQHYDSSARMRWMIHMQNDAYYDLVGRGRYEEFLEVVRCGCSVLHVL